VTGEIIGKPGSRIILKEGSLVEGKIIADQLIVDGFVKGNVTADTSVWVSSHGKIIGEIKTSALRVDPGGIFEAKVEMKNL
jgi:cytoskeletal protein CcmA (bactofilin family)